MHIRKLLIILIFLLFNSQSYAHYFSESFSKWNIMGSDIIANFSILELEATRVLQVKEYEKILIDNELDEKDIFKIYLNDHIHVYSADVKCQSSNDIRELSSDEGYLRYELEFQCPSEENIKIINNALFNVIQSHIHIARIYLENDLLTEKALFFNDQSVDISEKETQLSFFSSFKNFFYSGLSHILGGYDHLLFILGLLIIVTNLNRLILIITGFTIGHSLTLFLSLVEIVQVNASIVESLIGFTIMFVGLEYFYKHNNGKLLSIGYLILILPLLFILSFITNIQFSGFLMMGLLMFSVGYFFLKENLKNSDNLLILITIVFGLIHGFGFGGFLLNTEINSGNILSGLLGFNLGVEFGQILFVLGVLLIFQLVNFIRLNFIINLFKDTSFALLICFGLYFFIQRLIV